MQKRGLPVQGVVRKGAVRKVGRPTCLRAAETGAGPAGGLAGGRADWQVGGCRRPTTSNATAIWQAGCWVGGWVGSGLAVGWRVGGRLAGGW